MIGKYKKMGLMDYSKSSPLKINKPLWDLKAYIHELSENEIEGLSILKRELKEKQKEIEAGPLKMDPQNEGSIIGIKSRIDKSKIPKEIEAGPLKMDQRKIRKIKDGKEISIQDFMTLGEKLPIDEITNKSREFLNKLHNKSTKLRQSRKGAKSIFQGKLYYQILESLDECEGKTKRDFYTYLVKKYKRKNHASYQTYFPHLEHLNLVEEKDGILKLEKTGIKLISYIKEYGLDNIVEWIPKKY